MKKITAANKNCFFNWTNANAAIAPLFLFIVVVTVQGCEMKTNDRGTIITNHTSTPPTSNNVPPLVESEQVDKTSESPDWPLPAPAKTNILVKPVRVFDLLAKAHLRCVAEGYLLPDGHILFWGDGKEETQQAIYELNPVNGRTNTLWQGDAVSLRHFVVSPNRKIAWFAAKTASRPDQLYIIDITSRRVWPVSQIYGEGLSLLKDAIKGDHYWEVHADSDGRLLMEWSNPKCIANWWGKTQEYWQLRNPNMPEESNVYSRAILSSPEEWFRQANTDKRLPVAFEVSYQSRIKNKNDRPKPVSNKHGRFYAPIDDGVTFSDLNSLFMPKFGLRVQLFNRYRNPKTMMSSSAGNETRDEELRMWSSESSSTSARFQGAYVERADNGLLLHVLNHGIGIPESAVVSGSLFAMTGVTEEPVPANYVSLWDAPRGKLLAHLALPPKAVFGNSPTILLFSRDHNELYCLTTYSELYVWRLAPEWTALAKSRTKKINLKITANE